MPQIRFVNLYAVDCEVMSPHPPRMVVRNGSCSERSYPAFGDAAHVFRTTVTQTRNLVLNAPLKHRQLTKRGI